MCGLVVFVLLVTARSGHSGEPGFGSSLGFVDLPSRFKLSSYGYTWPSSTSQDLEEEAVLWNSTGVDPASVEDDATSAYPLVTILTPLAKSSIDDVPRFVDMLCRLSYPRNRLDLGFLVPEAFQDDAVALLSEVTLCQGYSTGLAGDVPAFRSVTYIVEPPPPPYPEAVRMQIEKDRHSRIGQPERRMRMARARNLLLTSMLGRIPDAEWILHLDVDIISLTIDEPAGMTALNVPFIEKMLDYGRTGAMGQLLKEKEQAADIVAPNVMVTKPDTGPDEFLVYDWNLWMSHLSVPHSPTGSDRPYPLHAETDGSRNYKSSLKPDKVVFEGEVVARTTHKMAVLMRVLV